MSRQIDLDKREKNIEECEDSIEQCLENIKNMWGEMSDYFDTITKLDKDATD